jgi:hypothetical protein
MPLITVMQISCLSRVVHLLITSRLKQLKMGISGAAMFRCELPPSVFQSAFSAFIALWHKYILKEVNKA